MIALLHTTWLAFRIWYLKNLLAAVERKGGQCGQDYLCWFLELVEVEWQAGVRS
jgi:hypothetical protein